MREIKFRAWNNDIKVMDYGNGELCGYNEFDSSPTATVNDIINQNYPELEWMQYTGIKDKNGNEIFEGDIVKIDNDLGVVVYREDICQFIVKFRTYTDYHWFFVKREVMGNIYENPELAEQFSNNY